MKEITKFYTAEERIQHDGKLYIPGDVISLTKEQAASMGNSVSEGVKGRPKEAPAAPPEPQGGARVRAVKPPEPLPPAPETVRPADSEPQGETAPNQPSPDGENAASEPAGEPQTPSEGDLTSIPGGRAAEAKPCEMCGTPVGKTGEVVDGVGTCCAKCITVLGGK